MKITTTPPLLYRKTPDGYALYIDPSFLKSLKPKSPPKYPLGLPCLVADGYGNVVGIAQRWVQPDGTVRCEVSGICEGECGSGSVPTAAGCCPTTYWCTPGGPVGVEAADGVYTPPNDATSGPYATEAEALEACPPPPIEVTCAECETPWLLPSDGFYLTFANQSGTSFPNTIWLEQGSADLNCSSGPTSGWGPGYQFDDGTTTASIRFCWSCPEGGGGGLSVEIYIFGVAAMILDPAPAGWLVASNTLRKVIPCGEQFAWDQLIGEVNFGSGTADVYLSN